jgi:hypothetical protein
MNTQITASNDVRQASQSINEDGQSSLTAFHSHRTASNSALLRGLVLFTAAVTCLTAADNRFISLGYSNSPVLQVLKASRQVVDGRALAESVKKSPNAKEMLARQLLTADAIGADLSEIEPTDEDVLIVDAAEQAGIPVIFENVTKVKMAKFFGLGVDNDLVVAEYNPTLRRGRLNFGEPLHLTDPEHEAPVMQERRTFAARLKVAQDVIQSRPFIKSAKPQAETNTGVCSAASSASSVPIPTSACQEWESSGLGPIYFLVEDPAGIEVDLTNFIDPEFFYGVYQVGTQKYVLLRATGGWGNALDAVVSTSSKRFPFFRTYKVQFQPITDWTADRYAPANLNNTSTITTTTGFSLTAGASAGQGSSGVNASATYSSSTASTVNVSDWTAQNNSSGVNSTWTYYMSDTYDCNNSSNQIGLYDSLTTMISYCSGSWENYVNLPPVWSRAGYSYSGTPLTEAVLRSGNSMETGMEVNYIVTATVDGLEISDHWLWYNWTSATTTRSAAASFYADASVVHN